MEYVCEVEFDSCSTSDATTYEDNVQTFIAGAEVGQWRYYKNGDPWWMSYTPVNGTNYFLVMTVSEAEISRNRRENSSKWRSRCDRCDNHQ